jgi:putative hydrolase of the HAD superfamily
MARPHLRAIFFDIDDTLYSTSEFSEIARANAIDAMIEVGLSLPREEINEELQEVIHEFSSNYEHHFDKLLLRIPKRYYKGINPAIVVAAGVIAYHETKIRQLVPYEDAVEVIKLLSQKTDLVLGIITEGLEVKQAEKLLRMRVVPYLTPNAVFISNQLGISKPNPKLYQRACSDLNIKPTETMYVGDNPAHDIDPPNSLGMMTVRMRRGGKHQTTESRTASTHEVQNFWDLLDYLRSEFSLPV